MADYNLQDIRRLAKQGLITPEEQEVLEKQYARDIVADAQKPRGTEKFIADIAELRKSIMAWTRGDKPDYTLQDIEDAAEKGLLSKEERTALRQDYFRRANTDPGMIRGLIGDALDYWHTLAMDNIKARRVEPSEQKKPAVLYPLRVRTYQEPK